VAVVLGAVAASFSHALFDFNLHIFANVHALIMIAGVAAARLYHEEVFTARQLKRSALVLLHGAVLLVGLAQVPPIVRAYLVDRYHEKGEALQSRLAYDEALAAFDRAVRWDPGYWKPYLGQADVYQTQSAWSLDADNRRAKANRAFEFYQMATERNPYDLDAYFGVSRAYEERGAADEAVQQMDAILARAPRDSFYLEQAALQRKRLGRLREALDLFQRAYALTPSDATERNIGALRRELATP
jgi:tetratricopeptide (TPR) repeat protein